MSERMICVLMSGGPDSILCAEMAWREKRLGVCVFFDYHQPAATQELQLSINWCTTHGVKLIRVSIDLIHSMNRPPGESGPRVVWGRNAAFLAVAANHALASRCGVLWFGANAADKECYPDCRPDFVMAMHEALFLAYGLEVEAPLLVWGKKRIMRMLREFGISAGETWSCYAPLNGMECRECDSCMEVRNALAV